MSQKRILVTGASGCIGHYISELLIQETEHELYLLVRNPDKLQVDIKARPGIHVLQGDMQRIGDLAELLQTIDVAVLTATAWGGTGTFDINVAKTIELLNLLDAEKCEQVIYFSTASVLDRNNQPLKEAGELGTDYIRSKFDCLRKFSKLAIAPKITKVFPTLVIGGDENKPPSQVKSGLPEVAKYVDLIRFLKADGSFHFIHAKDIATVVKHLIDNPPKEKEPGHINQSKFKQLYEEFATPNTYRTGSGAPGADYYQQKYKERAVRNLKKTAKSLGLDVVEQPTVQEVS